MLLKNATHNNGGSSTLTLRLYKTQMKFDEAGQKVDLGSQS